MRIIILALFLAAGVCGIALAFNIPAFPKDNGRGPSQTSYPLKFTGDINHGDIFMQPIKDDLVFLLKPSEWGWTLTVIDRRYPDHDYALVTLPDSFSNPRYIQTPASTEPVETVTDAPRFFEFVLNEKDFEIAQDAAHILTNSEGFSRPVVENAQQDFFHRVRKGRGRMTILSVKVASSPDGEKIERLTFLVEIEGPSRENLTPNTVRSVDHIGDFEKTVRGISVIAPSKDSQP